ncbi:hypothetical protein CLV28_0725 [Sediminihabitans luteus]|uniref:Uncharacterized protein n=1 Tax=Sediminihabitans luteus TaxID=1138585 RepID=A0A2M9CZY2_9CELL|nr:hypothetical protein [Sediminihabitans luteus]PJJ77506.1 hypothetical protein CLV28_0725 [Sediminihabitans luteus]GII98403.1 hypothetical protein Slu03_07810 [Sediminihabitans luteus]
MLILLGITLVTLGALLLVRVVVVAHRQRARRTTGAHGMGIAMGGSLVFWGALIVVVDP